MKHLLLVALFGVGAFGQAVLPGKPANDTKTLATAAVFSFGQIDQIVIHVIPKDQFCESVEVSIAYEDLSGTTKSRTVTVDRSMTWPETYGVLVVPKMKRLVSASIREIAPADTFTF